MSVFVIAAQQPGVGARADEVVLVGDLGGLAPARVDDDEAAAAILQRPDPVTHPRRGHDAAVRSERVAADAEEVVGPVDVGDREHPLVAEQLQRRDHVWELIHRGGRVAVLRPERERQREDGQQRAGPVRGRVADVEADGVAAVLAPDLDQAIGDVVERFVPVDALEAVLGPLQRMADPLGVGVEVLQSVALRADVTVRELVELIATDRDHLAIGVGDLKTAVRLAQRAGAVMKVGLGSGRAHPVPLSRRNVEAAVILWLGREAGPVTCRR